MEIMKTDYKTKFIFGGTSEVKNAIEHILEYIEYQENLISSLKEENNKLKAENYKDEELSCLKKELEDIREKMVKMYAFGFEITKEQHDAFEAWKKEHEGKVHRATTLEQRLKLGGAVGGLYTYQFCPTSIGTFGKVKCSCGAEFSFEEL